MRSAIAVLRRGFTLIELMITVALASVVMLLIYTVLIQQTESFRTQADMGHMQQNLRIALELLTRDIASAGFGSGADGRIRGAGGDDGDENVAYTALRVLADTPNVGHDAVELFMINPDRTTWGWLASANSQFQPCGAEEIVFRTETATRAALYGPDGYTRLVCFSPAARGGAAVSFVWDVASAGDGSTGSVPVTANSGYTDFSDVCDAGAGQGLPLPMICGPALHVAYYIDDQADGVGLGSPDLPVLYLVPDVDEVAATGYPTANDIPIGLGIEDLQVGICEGGNGVDVCTVDTDWTGDAYSVNNGRTWQDASAARVMVTARTLRPDPRARNVSARPDLDPNDGNGVVTTFDRFHRRTAATTVKLRNATGAWESARNSY